MNPYMMRGPPPMGMNSPMGRGQMPPPNFMGQGRGMPQLPIPQAQMGVLPPPQALPQPNRPFLGPGVQMPSPLQPNAPRFPSHSAAPRPQGALMPTPQSRITSVYVGKIDEEVDDGLILSLLQNCGKVVKWKRFTDVDTGKPKGFGFCDFESEEGVLRALRVLNCMKIGKKELMINADDKTKSSLELFEQSRKSGVAAEARAHALALNSAASPDDLNKAVSLAQDKYKNDEDAQIEKIYLETHKIVVARFGADPQTREEQLALQRGIRLGPEPEEEKVEEKEKPKKTNEETAREKDEERKIMLEERELEYETERQEKRRRDREAREKERQKALEREFARALRDWEAKEDEIQRDHERYLRQIEKEREKNLERSLIEEQESDRHRKVDPKLRRRFREREEQEDAADRRDEREELRQQEALAAAQPTTSETELEPAPQPAGEEGPRDEESQPSAGSRSPSSSPHSHDAPPQKGESEGEGEGEGVADTTSSQPQPAQQAQKRPLATVFDMEAFGEDQADDEDTIYQKKQRTLVPIDYDDEDGLPDEHAQASSPLRDDPATQPPATAPAVTGATPLLNTPGTTSAVPVNVLQALASKAKAIEEKAEQRTRTRAEEVLQRLPQVSVHDVIKEIPTEKAKLYSFPIDWDVVTEFDIINRKMESWVSKKVTELMGEPTPSMLSLILTKLNSRGPPQELEDALSIVLDDEAESFVVKMWRMFLFETIRFKQAAATVK